MKAPTRAAMSNRALPAALFAAIALLRGSPALADLGSDFGDPPPEWKTRPLWFWNGPLTKAATLEIMERSRESGYAGFGILPATGMSPPFMSPEFLERYGEALDRAAALGMKMCLYDEYWFPSGAAAGELAKRYPEALGKRLDMLSADVQGPASFRRDIPGGALLGAVAMNTATWELLDLGGRIAEGKLSWEVPAGPWRIMIFTCVTDGARGLVDYLDPEAVRKFASLTYERYYEKFKGHFGKTIDSAFYDEPTFHWIEGGRAWTPAFNAKFQARHGRSPALDYPALWYDIGPDTASARNDLLGFRAELYAEGFVKVLSDWCREHGIALTGHHDQEEVVNPVGLCGDLMKSFRHQEIPGIDQIFQYGRASKAYKVVSSAAVNYDRRLVMTECYGAIQDMPVANLYREAMDQFAKGINLMVPHAVWYRLAEDIFPPELSFRSPVYGPALPAYNVYMGRLQRILQQGRHAADIGVLYPIATLQAGYRFGVGKPYEGGVIPPEADYMDVGEILSLQVRRDFTFLHPEVLDGRCSVEGPVLHLKNRLQEQRYRVFILPGSRAVHWSNLEKILRFFEEGGTVIATTELPRLSAERGKDREVQEAVARMFGPPESRPAGAGHFRAQANAKGGKSYFIARPTAAALRAALDDALPVPDVKFEEDVAVSGGSLSYIHKVLEDRDVYFFANSSDTAVDCRVKVRGRLEPGWWDPHTGRIEPAECDRGKEGADDVTRLRLVLKPVESRFLVAPKK